MPVQEQHQTIKKALNETKRTGASGSEFNDVVRLLPIDDHFVYRHITYEYGGILSWVRPNQHYLEENHSFQHEDEYEFIMHVTDAKELFEEEIKKMTKAGCDSEIIDVYKKAFEAKCDWILFC